MVFQLPYEFVDKSVTPGGGMRLMKEFLNKTDIEEQIKLLDLPKSGTGLHKAVFYDMIKFCRRYLDGEMFPPKALIRGFLISSLKGVIISFSPLCNNGFLENCN